MPSMGLSLHTSIVYIINIATRHVPIATSIIIQPDLAVRSVYYDSVILMICPYIQKHWNENTASYMYVNTRQIACTAAHIPSCKTFF